MYLATNMLVIIFFLMSERALGALSSNPPDNISVTCEEDHMEIEIAVTKFPKLDPAKFHLKDKNCLSTVSGDVIKLRTSLNDCGTTAVENSNTTIYKNVVRAYDIVNSSAEVSVTRDEDLTLPFNCSYNRRDTVSMTSFQPLRRVDAAEGSLGNFTFLMDLFTANDFQTPYTEKDYPLSIQINDPVFVQFQVKASKADLHIFAEKCLATTTTSETSKPSYVFLESGCPLDSTMVYNYSPNRIQNFTINAFRFIADHPIIYLHCLLMVCHSKSNGTKCASGCVKKRRKRDVLFGDNLKTGGESTLYHLASGPLTRKRIKDTLEIIPPTDTNYDSQTTLIVAIVAMLGVSFLITSVILIACLLWQRKAVNARDLEPLQLRQYDGDWIFLPEAESCQKLTVHI